jgi:hypothetical protein
MLTLHGFEIKVDDKVWDSRYGWSKVIELYDGEKYEIVTNLSSYTTDGKNALGHNFPSLFWNEFEVPKEAFIKPLPNLKVDTKVLVWNDIEEDVRIKRYFSHFDSNGTIHCFYGGATSFTNIHGTTDWDHWKLYEEQ